MIYIITVLMSIQAWCLPSDKLQRCTEKALSGRYGKLDEWQRVGYSKFKANKIKYKSLKIVATYYGPWEASGIRDSRGDMCTYRTCASNKLPRGTYIWTPYTGIRQVLDSGAKSNDYTTKWIVIGSTYRKGVRSSPDKIDAVWVDIWYPNHKSAGKLRQYGYKLLYGGKTK